MVVTLTIWEYLFVVVGAFIAGFLSYGILANIGLIRRDD